MTTTTGPLTGLRVVELGGIGPVPHAAMVLGDLGADVVRIQRVGGHQISDPARDHLLRSRRTHTLDLKSPADRDEALLLVDAADVLLEGFRPGVAERLGFGPGELTTRNPRLVYGRMTGWGREGPLADAVGHDINYLALNGTLHAIGSDDRPPTAPLNLVGDFGGGSMLLVTGVLGALWERERSGRGQVVDAAMVDGSALLMQAIWAWRGTGDWTDERGRNLLDGGAPFYRCYRCADGRYVAVGAIEPQFYSDLLKGLGLAGEDLPHQDDRSAWPNLTDRFAAEFATRPRDEWADVFADLDACVTPVLDFAEASAHPHATARAAFLDLDGVVQPAPAPRFSRSQPARPSAPRPPAPVTDTLRRWTRDGHDPRIPR
jgi:alpha-methylacyl-CoA racemase